MSGETHVDHEVLVRHATDKVNVPSDDAKKRPVGDRTAQPGPGHRLSRVMSQAVRMAWTCSARE